MFNALDKCEDILSKQRHIAGDRFTEADVRLFVTLIRYESWQLPLVSMSPIFFAIIIPIALFLVIVLVSVIVHIRLIQDYHLDWCVALYGVSRAIEYHGVSHSFTLSGR